MKIKRLLIINSLKVTNEWYRNWINSVNVLIKPKLEVINEIMGKLIYI